MLHSFLSERKWGYYVQMHDNKEKEWREHSFLTPTLLHHTPIATLCHPTPSFLPVLFLVYWIFLFSRPGNKSCLFVLWALFLMGLIHRNVVTRQPSSYDIPSTALGRKSLLPFAIHDHKPQCIFFFFTLRSNVLNARLSTVTHNEGFLLLRRSVLHLLRRLQPSSSVRPDVATEKLLSIH